MTSPNMKEILESNKNETRMNLNTGPININLDITKHIQPIKDALQISFDSKLASVLDKVKLLLSNNKDPNTSAAAAAW